MAALLLVPGRSLLRGGAAGGGLAGALFAARDAPPLDRAAALLLYLAGAVHLGLVPGDWAEERGTALLFLLNGAAFWALAVALPRTPQRRGTAALLCLATLLAYLAYVLSGREDPDQAGLAAALLELTALCLLLTPRRGGTWRWLAVAATLLAATLVTGCATWAAALRPAAAEAVRPTRGTWRAAPAW